MIRALTRSDKRLVEFGGGRVSFCYQEIQVGFMEEVAYEWTGVELME